MADTKYRKIKKKVKAIQAIQQKKKNRKKIQTYHQGHDDNNDEIIIINNIDTNEMECHACGLKGHKIEECQTKQNIYLVNLKKTVRSKLEIQEKMLHYGNIKSIKVRRDRYGYEINETMVCYTTQREADEAVSEINKGTEWHAEISQNRYAEINEGRNKRQRKMTIIKKVKEIKQIRKDKIIKSRKRIDKWQKEIDNLKPDKSQIKEYTKTIMDNKE